MTRTAIFELVQALKFKVSMPDTNFLLLANLVLHDAGSQLVGSGLDPDTASSLDVADPGLQALTTAACEVSSSQRKGNRNMLVD
jgi:hypothetical protein